MLSLHFEKGVDVFHRENRFGNNDVQQRCDLLPGILLFDGMAQNALFDIIAHHGGGQFYAAEGAKIAVDILDRLVQIQPNGGKLLIARQRKACGTGRNTKFGFRFHSIRSYTGPGRQNAARVLFFVREMCAASQTAACLWDIIAYLEKTVNGKMKLHKRICENS